MLSTELTTSSNLKALKALEKKTSKFPPIEQTVFKIGDLVAIYDPRLIKGRKIVPQYKGPYLVSRASQSKKVYYVRDEFGDENRYPISVLRMKPWSSRDIQSFNSTAKEFAEVENNFENSEMVQLAEVLPFVKSRKLKQDMVWGKWPTS